MTVDLRSGREEKLLDEPLDPATARSLVRSILAEGTYRFTRHAEKRMEERNMTHTDCLNVLRGGVVRGEYTTFENGTWRYRVETPAMAVVVAFRSETSLVVVTPMRLR